MRPEEARAVRGEGVGAVQPQDGGVRGFLDLGGRDESEAGVVEEGARARVAGVGEEAGRSERVGPFRRASSDEFEPRLAQVLVGEISRFDRVSFALPRVGRVVCLTVSRFSFLFFFLDLVNEA